MADFKIAYQKTMGHEGGWANDPDDSGGETWKGIARNYHPNWSGWTIIDALKVGRSKAQFEPLLFDNRGLQEDVWSFYKRQFWDVNKLDRVTNQEIANEVFDTGVNMNYTIAAEFLQRALNATNRNGRDYPDIDEDGQIGSQTLGVLNSHPRPQQILKLLNCQQGVRYMEICRKRPSQEKFMTSWMSRVAI
jgi:lysozyme family protein